MRLDCGVLSGVERVGRGCFALNILFVWRRPLISMCFHCILILMHNEANAPKAMASIPCEKRIPEFSGFVCLCDRGLASRGLRGLLGYTEAR